MKKRHFLLFSLSLIFAELHAAMSFGGLDLNQKDSLLFYAQADMPGVPSYKSLFRVDLGTKGIQGKAEPLTCFPERMELLDGGTILQIRNRYGTAWYNTHTNSLFWYYVNESLPAKYSRIGAIKASPDGKWLCYIKQTGFVTGDLVLQSTLSEESCTLVEGIPFSYETVPVKWSPDSKVVLYEDEGTVYFATVPLSKKNTELPKELRSIGRGSIQSVEWTSSSALIYLSGDIIYRIKENELYTRGLYAPFIGGGEILGRLPYSFTPSLDRFWVSPSGDELAVITGKKTVSLYGIKKGSYHFVSVKAVQTLTSLSGTLLSCDVFWSSQNRPILWLDILRYKDAQRSSMVYIIGDSLTPVLNTDVTTDHLLSPDRKFIAFSGASSLFVYDISTWKRIARASGEGVRSFCWASSSKLYVGGEDTISELSLESGAKEGATKHILYLSAAEDARWNGERIVARVKSGAFYSYNKTANRWQAVASDSGFSGSASEKNGKFRVFLGKAQNNRFSNAIFVRSLSSSPLTYPLYAETETPYTPQGRVAIVFDAENEASGLSETLFALNTFSLEGTFFINGEFIRRYPEETRQIAGAGHECAAGFFTATDLTSAGFSANDAFIKRGLARNEDEFFATTGKELSLLWHAPLYRANTGMRKAALGAGYRYVDAYQGTNDRSSMEDAMRTAQKYQSASQIIETIAKDLKDGIIIPISVGKIQGSRADYLYEKLDLLIAAILTSGYTIVNVRDLIGG